MNGENNFGNNGNKFGFNTNPNDMNNNVNSFNQGMQPNQEFNNPNSFNQGMEPNQGFNNPNNFNQGMQQNQGFNNPNNFNQGMQPNQGFNNPNNFNQGMQPNQGFNNPNNFNQGMQPNQPINGGANTFINPTGVNVPANNGGKGKGNKKKKFLIIGGVVVGVIVVLILIVSLVGSAGSKDTLTCKTTLDSDDVKIEITDVYTFEDGYNSRIDHTYILSKDGGYTDENVQAFKDELGDEEITTFGWEPKVTKSGKKIKITSYTPRMSTEDYETVKKAVEDSDYDYKCK